MSDGFIERLVERYPRFRAVWAARLGDRIPVVLQQSDLECGLACVAMVAGLHGRHGVLEELRSQIPRSPGAGVDAAAVLEAGRLAGMRGRAVKVDFSDLATLEVGTVLHWNMGHYVVFAGKVGGGYRIVDPAYGLVNVDEEEVRKRLTGIGLLFEPGADFSKRPRNDAIAVTVLRPFFERSIWTRVVTMSLLLQLLAFALPGMTSIIIERVLPAGDTSLLGVMTVVALVAGAFFCAASVVRAKLVTLVHIKASVQLRSTYYERVIQAPLRFYMEHQPGRFALYEMTIDALLSSLSSGVVLAAVDVVFAVVMMVALVIADLSLAMTTLVVVLLTFAVMAVSRPMLRDLTTTDLYLGNKLVNEVTETLSGIEAVKLSGAESRRMWALMNGLATRAESRGRVESLKATVWAIQAGLTYLGPIVVLVVGSYRVVGGYLGLAQMLAITALAAAVLFPVSRIATALMDLPALEARLKELEYLFQIDAEQNVSERRVAPQLTGAVSVRGLTFSFGPRLPPALKDVSLEITPGQFVAIVGRSGAGKTTLASLLVGLYQPAHGRIEFDGLDIQTLDLVSLRRQIGFVPQRPFIFSQTIRQNISADDPGIRFEAIVDAAKRACIHDDIVALPLGYETPVGSFAVFSGGQRQRLSLARALVRNPPIIILDEATSAVDNITEGAIQANIDRLRCTRIVIAHRLSTIRRADRVVLIADGRIVDQGSHGELLERCKEFRDLYGGQELGSYAPGTELD